MVSTKYDKSYYFKLFTCSVYALLFKDMFLILTYAARDEMEVCFVLYALYIRIRCKINVNASACFLPACVPCNAFLIVNSPINVRGSENAESVKALVFFHMDCLPQIYPLRKEKAMNILVILKITFVGLQKQHHNCPAELCRMPEGL